MSEKFCRQYAKRGTCTYGASCKFSHVAGADVPDGYKAKPTTATPPSPLSESDLEVRPAWGAESEPTTFAPYPHHVYSPNDYIHTYHPDFEYTPKSPVQYTPNGHLVLLTPLDDFFASFPDFEYNPYASVTDELSRLIEKRFPRKTFVKYSPEDIDIERRANIRDTRQRFNRALVDQSRVIFGVERDSLRAWQTLYEALGVDPLPGTVKECYQMINGVFVNMVDVVDAIRINRLGVDYKVPVFPTEQELSKYTKKLHRYFPLGAAHESGLLERLLRYRYINDPRKPEEHDKPPEALKLQTRDLLSRLAADRVTKMNAINLEVAMAKDALSRLRI